MIPPLKTPNDIRLQRKARSKAARLLVSKFRKIVDQPLCLSYSAPKTGSKTVTATITDSWDEGNVVHLHSMAPGGLARLNKLAEAGRREHVWHKQIKKGIDIRALVEARRAIAHTRGAVAEKIYVIAGVRDPVAMHFSAMFEWHWHYVDNVADYRPEFLAKSFSEEAWHRWADAWFAEELLEVFGIDYRQHCFPHEQGHVIIETEIARVLIIRTENLDNLSEALGQLYRQPASRFPVARTNITAARAGGAAFAEIVARVRLSAAELAPAYDLPSVRHFYTDAERTASLRRWTEKLSG